MVSKEKVVSRFLPATIMAESQEQLAALQAEGKTVMAVITFERLLARRLPNLGILEN
ncbi:MAG TPA: hypothetical protein VHV10_01735 [Ktedonobacteraceae bacterium]|nr:hypothetical protein [Ktedonobacteraceae bacterium]